MSNNIYESLRMENASLNTLYKNAMSKMKKMQNEYESIYLNYLNENQQRENTIKNNYFKYQNLLQKHYEKEEKNNMEEIKNLKIEINEKNKIINTLQKNIADLKDKLTKNELIYHLKEKEYQKELERKDRLLMKSSDVVKKNSKEVMEDIKKLKEEINFFQNKLYMNNINNNKTINNNNSQFKINNYSNYQLKKNPSLSNFNDLFNCNCNCHKFFMSNFNKSFNKINYPNLKQGQISLINNISDDNNKIYEIYKLRHKIKNLNNIIRQKDEEILFWKNFRRDLHFSNNKLLHTQNYENILNTLKIDTKNKNFNHTSTINNTNQNKKYLKRSHSQSESHFLPLKKKINLNLIDSNINKPAIRSIISSEEKE